jgi:two-component system, NarL family, response regulator DevR
MTVGGAIRVLIADDHRMFAESVARLLDDEADVNVVAVAGTVADALQKAEATRPDVAIVDFRLPDGDGATLTRELIALSPATHVLVLTGAGDERLLVASVEAGCAGFLTKDKALTELVAAVRLASVGEAYIPTQLLAALLPKLGVGQKGLGSDLTSREREILQYLRSGESTSSIAASQFLSIHTVRNHVRNILAKLDAHSKLEAVAIANREGLFEVEG